MGKNIKIELELPEFEKELVVSVTLKRDGEVTYVSSPSSDVKTEVRQEKPVWRQDVPKNTSGSSWSNGGNMMDINF